MSQDSNLLHVVKLQAAKTAKIALMSDSDSSSDLSASLYSTLCVVAVFMKISAVRRPMSSAVPRIQKKPCHLYSFSAVIVTPPRKSFVFLYKNND